MAFGNVLVGSAATTVLTITNNGNSSLAWTGLSTGTTVVTSSATSGTVAAGASVAITLTFSPTSAQTYTGSLTLTSNATSGTSAIAFSGTGTTAAPPPVVTPGLSCGVERWPVKTLADAGAAGVNMSNVQVITIQALNDLPSHCSGLPDPRTYPPEFQVYETTGRILVVRSEDDRDYHLALSDPNNSNSTIVTELADVACSGAATSIYRDLLASARSQFETFRAGQSLASLTGRLVTVRGVGFYDFAHGQTGRSRNCLELHPVTYIAGGQAPAAPVVNSFTATPSSITYPASAVLAWSVSDATSVSISNGIGAVEAIGQRTVTPSITTTYTLTATNSGGSATQSKTVTVGLPSNSCPASSYPSGTTAVCNDGTTSQSQNRSGTCSSHGGVRCWICPGVLCGG